MPTALLLTAHGPQGNVIDWWIKTELFWIWSIPEMKIDYLIYKDCIGILFSENGFKNLIEFDAARDLTLHSREMP